MAEGEPKGAEIALVIALAYVIQIQTSAWCNRFVDRCFGQEEPLGTGPRD